MTVLKFRAWVVNESNRFMAYPHDTQLNSAISNALQHQLGLTALAKYFSENQILFRIFGV